MKKLLLLFATLLATVGAWAQTTVTIVDGASQPYDTYGTRTNSVSPNRFSSNTTSGLADVVLTAPVIDRANWWSTQCLAVKNSDVQTNEDVTITAPGGYIIKSISMSLQAYSSNSPYDVTVNGEASTITGASAKEYTNLDVNATSFSFTIKSTGSSVNWLAVKSMTLVVEEYGSYDAAMNAITDGGNYRISTEVSGTKYYVTSGGTLTSTKANGEIFTITKVSGGSYKTNGLRITSNNENKRFTNPPLSNSIAVLNVSNFSTSTGERADWETQVPFLNADGKFAIRSCNTSHAVSSWGDAGRTFWTWKVEPVTPQYSYAAAYVWNFEEVLATVQVTYDLYESDGTTKVSSVTVTQDANSELISPLPGTGITYNGFFHEKFYYDYTVDGTIGDTDCTITITRTEKAGVVKALTDLSNNKAYNIGCDRGAMIAYNGSMVSTALNDADANAQPYGKFALLKYEDNYYIFSIDENKFIKNDASVALDLTAVGFSTEDAMVMTAQTDNAPYFLWTFNADGKYLNTNGNAPLGYVINSYNIPDEGNKYYMVSVDDFDPTAALAELDAYFNPSYTVIYKVKDTNGNVIFTSDPQPTKAGAKITTLLAEFQRPFYTYNEVNVDIAEQETTVEFTATWVGPFEISADFDNAHWYDMAMRMVEGQQAYYVTSAKKDGDGAYQTQLANTMGLVEDSYQWAFLGNGYDGFKILNKAEGTGKSFGWTDAAQTNEGIPTIMDDGEGHHAWKIVPSTNTNVPAGSFCLNVPGTSLYINQYGGAGGSVKFWNSESNLGDAGSAFTVFDVPSNFASFVVDEIAPYFESTAKYFVFSDAAKTTVGYDESYKTECSFAQYKSMKEKLTANFIADLSNYVLPETGFYILKNKNYGTYMGMDPSDLNLYGNYESADKVKNIVKLTKGENNTYSISLEGVYAPATVEQSQPVTAADEEVFYTVKIPAVGYAAFQADPEVQYSCLHCRAAGDLVGWEAPNNASQWEAIVPTDPVEVTVNDGGDGNYYATFCVPFDVTISGASAYTLTLNGNTALTLSDAFTEVPAGTPVFLKGTSATATATINTSTAFEPVDKGSLTGTYVDIQVSGGTDYFLGKVDNKVGFYHWNGSTLKANRAYLEATKLTTTPEGVKGFAIDFDSADAIKSLFDGEQGNGEWYDLSGRRVSQPTKGLYIMNGKKVIVK